MCMLIENMYNIYINLGCLQGFFFFNQSVNFHQIKFNLIKFKLERFFNVSSLLIATLSKYHHNHKEVGIFVIYL